MALIEVSSSIIPIDPSEIFADGFELSQQTIIPSQDYSGSFTPGLNNMEFFVYNAQNQIQYSEYNFIDYSITNNSNPNAGPSGVQLGNTASLSTTNIIDLNPEQDVYNVGFSNGKLTAVYNFINHELSSSISNPYYLSEISADRTEIRLKSNYISNSDMQSSFITFEETLKQADFFDEFYISFGDNESHIGVNTKFESPSTNTGGRSATEIDGVPAQNSILIKLYDALPLNYQLESELYVYTKTGETQAYVIEFEENINIPDESIRLKGPNTNLNIKDFVNNSSTYKSKEELLKTNSSSSKDQLINVLEQKGIKLTPNYSTASFNEFVNFSSAKSRVNNFYIKVSRIQTYENDIRLLSATTGSNSGAVSSSIASLWTKVENEIKNFDGFEYYQYYNTGSDAYPKTGSIFPQPLLSTGSVEVLRWLGSDVENSQYYGGTLLSASFYDNDNQNWLYYTIPTFITEQNNNDNYVEFCNLVGQSFDELWLYTKAITEKLNTTNELDKGVPLSLADDVITSLGYTGFGNNYNNQDNFIGLIGNDNGDYLPPTGSELITNYIAINGGNIVNYWQDGYSFDNYVEQLLEKGFPYPIDKVSKEIFKRLYHNMAYLVKKKGTVAGLRQLINIWGIPSTILRINEFGGKNKDETDDYDLWYRRYSYAFTPVANSYQASASAIIPWMPLQRNYIAETEYIVPDGVGFRFKTTGYPSSSYAGNFTSQSLAVKKSNGTDDDEFDWGIALFYTGSTSGSYSGSSNSDYRDYGQLKFYMSGAAADGGVAESDPIYLPFFDKGWWTVLLQRDNHNNSDVAVTTYTLYAKNKLYDGWDGNSIGFEASTSISNYDSSSGGVFGTGLYNTALYGGYISESINNSWNKYGVNELDGVYIGGRLNGSRISNGFITNEAGFGFSGSFQEFRYYSNAITESVFNDFVMNPESIEGNKITGSQSSFDIINFRAPLGNELKNVFTASQFIQYTESISSVHPSITGSAPEYITSSFINPANNTLTSSYYIQYEANSIKRTYSKENTETYFLDQPSIGIRNRISNKIQVQENLNFGTALSEVVSIQKDPFISQSYTENINTLEVAFSPQDEINDDIIQTLGYGAIQSAIADPRFRSQSADSYPQLDKIANDYFRKYVGSDVFAYLRLIKYFDDSLFKAIKNYVPARTSVSTGVVIKQNMLERNRYREPQVNAVTTQSYAIQNIPLTTKNLELTGNIEIANIEGGAGGSVNEYNVQISQSGYFSQKRITGGVVPGNGYLNLSDVASTLDYGTATNPYGNLYGEQNYDFGSLPNGRYLKSNQPVKAHISMYAKTDSITALELIISSSLRGELNRGKINNGFSGGVIISPLISILPEETIGFFANNDAATGGSNFDVGLTALTIKSFDYTTPASVINQSPNSDISSSYLPSKQTYIKNNITTLGVVSEIEDYQEEFYDGEYSGSAIKTLITQSNPYKSIPPSSVLVSPSPTALNHPFIIGPNDVDNPASFTSQTANGWDYNSQGEIEERSQLILSLLNGLLFNGIAYTINYTATVIDNNYPSSVGQYIGPSPFTYVARDPSIPISAANFKNMGANGFDTQSIQDVNGGGNVVTTSGSPAKTINYSITFTFQSPVGFPTNVGYPLAFQLGSIQDVTISNFTIVALTNNISQTEALIPWDLNVINNYNPLTSGSFNIWNTQSIIFETSDYNPLNNNVEDSRKSTNHYLLSYNDTTYPENLQSIIGVMYNPLSSSTKATVPDSNYSSLAALNPTYRGTNIKSLDYNFFTPSGSVRPVKTLPASPYNLQYQKVSSSVATSFLNGETGSWGGDDLGDGRKSAVIDKYPQYIAHFQRSFEQFNLYGSREFTIDSLIAVPSTSIAGQEITPNSTEIDGSNEHKKWVSSVFQPDRKIGVSFTPTTTDVATINLETIQVGDYDLEGGSIQYLTLNSNARSILTNSNRYSYNLGKQSLTETLKLGFSSFTSAMDGLPAFGYVGIITGSVNSANISSSGSGIVSTINASISDFNNNPNALIPLNNNADPDSSNSGGGTFGYIQISRVNNNREITGVTFYGSAWDNTGLVPINVQANRYKAGDTITVPASIINASPFYNSMVGNLTFTLTQENILESRNRNTRINPNTIGIAQDSDAIQMVTASQVTGDGQQFGFLLSGSGTHERAATPGSGATLAGMISSFYVPFSDDNPASGFRGMPDENKLAIAGPQLAVMHTYNQMVASQSVRPALLCPFINVSESKTWINSGIDASDPQNYYQWAPSASDCPTYEDNAKPFLIERGDILRVEGTKEILSATTSNLSSSIDFIEDFLVEEVQNFFYTSSTFAPVAGTFVVGSGPTNNDVISSPLNQFPAGYSLGTFSFNPGVQTTTTFSTNGGGSGGTIQLAPQVSDNRSQGPGNPYVIEASGITFTTLGNGGYAVGDTITIISNTINLLFGSLQLNNIVITLTSAMLNTGGLANNFAVYAAINPGCGPSSGEQPYQKQKTGEIALDMPTFIKTYRNPSTVLEGLPAGEITKFTLKKRVENETKVMTKNTPTTIGSQGYLTQTGGGFLIPKDLSEIQTSNALNIINQLRQKNAFPGDSTDAVDSADNQTS